MHRIIIFCSYKWHNFSQQISWSLIIYGRVSCLITSNESRVLITIGNLLLEKESAEWSLLILDMFLLHNLNWDSDILTSGNK